MAKYLVGFVAKIGVGFSEQSEQGLSNILLICYDAIAIQKMPRRSALKVAYCNNNIIY
jgi:hypothetical protein